MTTLHNRLARLRAKETNGTDTTISLLTPMNNKIGVSVGSKTVWVNTDTFLQAVHGIIASQYIGFEEPKAEGTTIE